MKPVITIQIIRPQIEDLAPSDRKLLIEELAKDIAEQILKQEELRQMHESIAYWQKRLIDWEIEDRINEIKYGQLRSSIEKH